MASRYIREGPDGIGPLQTVTILPSNLIAVMEHVRFKMGTPDGCTVHVPARVTEEQILAAKCGISYLA